MAKNLIKQFFIAKSFYSAKFSPLFCQKTALESLLLMMQETRERRLRANGGLNAFERGKRIREIFPGLADEIISLANQDLEGMLVLPGTGPEPFFVGNPPKWKENPCGDFEYTYSLNRMFHTKRLAEAYSLTGDEKYAEKAIAELSNWIDTVDCPPLMNADGTYNLEAFDCCSPWRALEVGIRGYRSWPIMIEILIDSPSFTEKLFNKLLESCRKHCEVLYKISPRLWPKADHNHYIMENLGLLSFVLLFPELDENGDMLMHAEKELSRCIQNQCTERGGQIEGCPSYHNGSVYWFSLRNTISRKYRLNVPDEYTESLKKMFAHSVHATRPFGGNFPWGDSHTADKETMSLAAVACYMATGDREYLQMAAYFYPQSTINADLRDNLWRFSDIKKLKDDYAFALSSPLCPDLPNMEWDKELKQVYMRTGWDKNAVGIMTACRTPIQNNHAHMDPGGFDFVAYGEPLVSDPGIYTYKNDENRYHFKSTGWHNCAMINSHDAWEYKGSWRYGEQKWGDIITASSDSDSMTVISEHMNYEPVRLKRILSLIDKRFLAVVDIASGMDSKDTLDASFHLNSDRIIIRKENSVITEKSQKPNVALFSAGSSRLEILNARISTGNDIWHDSLIARFHKSPDSNGKAMHAALLIPLETGEAISSPVCFSAQYDENSVSLSFCFSGIEYSIHYNGEKATLRKKEIN